MYLPELCFTGFRGVHRDSNLLVPDAQQPPADQDIDSDRGGNGDPCSENKEFFEGCSDDGRGNQPVYGWRGGTGTR